MPVRNRPMIEEVQQGERQERWKLRTVLLGRIWRTLHLTLAFKEMRQLADASLPGGPRAHPQTRDVYPMRVVA